MGLLDQNEQKSRLFYGESPLIFILFNFVFVGKAVNEIHDL